MDHLHHDGHVFLRSGAQVVLDVALPLELEHHLLNGHTLPANAAELVPQPVCHTFQRVLDEGLPLRTHRDTHLLIKLSRQRPLSMLLNRKVSHIGRLEYSYNIRCFCVRVTMLAGTFNLQQYNRL